MHDRGLCLRLLALCGLLASAFSADATTPTTGGGSTSSASSDVHHDQAVKSATADVAAKQRTVDNLQKSIDTCDKRLHQLAEQLSKAKSDLDAVVNIEQEITDAKAALDAADQQVQKEYQQNHNYGTNSGGASLSTVKAQEDAQKKYQELKREEADASSLAPRLQSHVHALESQQAQTTKRKEKYQQELDDATQKLTAAQTLLTDLQSGAGTPAPVQSPPPTTPASKP